MPSPTIASGFLSLWLLDEAPWHFPAWQDITNIRSSLTPSDDKDLPKGWSRENADDFSSFVSQFKKCASEDDRIKFVEGRGHGVLPGRDAWKRFINSGWKTWRIQQRIIDCLKRDQLHPVTIMVLEQDLKTWPRSDYYLPLALDTIGLELFGQDAVDVSGRLPFKFRQPTQAIAQRTWVSLYVTFRGSETRLANLESKAREAFSDLDREKLTKSSLTKVFAAVKRWKDLAEVLCTEAVEAKIVEMEHELERLMNGLKGISMPANKPSGLCKVTKDMLSSLASSQDLHDLVHVYEEFFNTPSDNELILKNRPHLGFRFGDAIKGADPGMEIECGMSKTQLSNSLGFENGLPIVFNRYCHTGGLLSWSDEHAPFFTQTPPHPDLEPLSLHWHQLAGVHSVIRNNFTATAAPAGTAQGMLIADEVGLGKTFLAITIMAFLSHLVMLQAHPGAALPPIIDHLPYLGNDKQVPSLPHLIVVPGTLTAQWEHEIKLLYQRKMIDIFIYGSGKTQHDQFWAVDGPFIRSRHMASQKIIIASHSALQQDFTLCFEAKRPHGSTVPWTTPLPRVQDMSKTLFGQEYLTVALDEAHLFRNIGGKHSAALLLLMRARLRLVLTATPLQTSTKDISAMGRLVGVPFFLSVAAHDQEKQDMTCLRRAKKELSEDYDPLDGGEDPIRLEQVKIAQRLQTRFEGHILRRTIDSKDNSGNTLLNIPPYEAIHVILDVTKREKVIIDALAQEAKENVSTANGVGQFSTKSFYLEYRIAVGFAREQPNSAIPIFKSLAEWEPLKSTKIDVCARLCKYLLSHDNTSDIIIENGSIIFPPIPKLQTGETAPQDTRILIYQEFPSLGSLLRNILALYGVRCLFIDGQTSFEQRAAIVTQFGERNSPRVLIISSVGSNGLNLAVANVIIFLDQPWSAQDERQIRGRAHRQPQKKVVKVYHLLANETADILLSDMAKGKQDMLEAFLSKETGHELSQLLSGKTIVLKDAIDADDPHEGHPKKHAGKQKMTMEEKNVEKAERLRLRQEEKERKAQLKQEEKAKQRLEKEKKKQERENQMKEKKEKERIRRVEEKEKTSYKQSRRKRMRSSEFVDDEDAPSTADATKVEERIEGQSDVEMKAVSASQSDVDMAGDIETQSDTDVSMHSFSALPDLNAAIESDDDQQVSHPLPEHISQYKRHPQKQSGWRYKRPATNDGLKMTPMPTEEVSGSPGSEDGQNGREPKRLRSSSVVVQDSINDDDDVFAITPTHQMTRQPPKATLGFHRPTVQPVLKHVISPLMLERSTLQDVHHTTPLLTQARETLLTYAHQLPHTPTNVRTDVHHRRQSDLEPKASQPTIQQSLHINEIPSQWSQRSTQPIDASPFGPLIDLKTCNTSRHAISTTRSNQIYLRREDQPPSQQGLQPASTVSTSIAGPPNHPMLAIKPYSKTPMSGLSQDSAVGSSSSHVSQRPNYRQPMKVPTRLSPPPSFDIIRKTNTASKKRK